MAFRIEPTAADVEAVRRLIAGTGFFLPHEVAVAAELVQERLAKGEASDYFFYFADGEDGELAGYANYGPIPCTIGRHNLYWIAVRPGGQGKGLGRRLMAAVEEDVLRRRGCRLYVETSTKAQYEPTRAFYEKIGYVRDATMTDFYYDGDGKAIYLKILGKEQRP